MEALDNEKSQQTNTPVQAAKTPAAGGHRPTVGNSNGGVLLSRRALLYGAIGAGALAATGIAINAVESSDEGPNASLNELTVPVDALKTLDDFKDLESYESSVQNVSQFDLPYGSLAWSSDASLVVYLIPTESGSPLTQIGLLHLGNGNDDILLKKAIGAAEGFEIYDVRANAEGLVWTEANISRGLWRVYAAPFENTVLGSEVLLEEGNARFEMPRLAVAGKRVLWLVNLKSNSESGEISDQDIPELTDETSESVVYETTYHTHLSSATFKNADKKVLFESDRPAVTSPYIYEQTVTIAHQSEESSDYYKLINLDVTSGELCDELVLPYLIRPVEAAYGPTGFMFSFPEIYDRKSAIANLGTYVPCQKPDGSYNDVDWFCFERTPTAAPLWCGNLLIIKSSYSICGINLKKDTYFAIDVDNGASSYGDYLASTTTNDSFVSYTNIDHKPIGEKSIYNCRVKLWSPA